MALDRGRALGAWFRGGHTVRVGFRMDGTRNASASCSAEEAGCGGLLSLRAEPDVLGVLRGLGGTVGGRRSGELSCDQWGVRGGAGRGLVCAAVRGAAPAEHIRRGV